MAPIKWFDWWDVRFGWWAHRVAPPFPPANLLLRPQDHHPHRPCRRVLVIHRHRDHVAPRPQACQVVVVTRERVPALPGGDHHHRSVQVGEVIDHPQPRRMDISKGRRAQRLCLYEVFPMPTHRAGTALLPRIGSDQGSVGMMPNCADSTRRHDPDRPGHDAVRIGSERLLKRVVQDPGSRRLGALQNAFGVAPMVKQCRSAGLGI
jgi:hypothetical protein